MDSCPTARRYTTGRSNPHRGHTRIRRQQGGLRRLIAFQALVSIILFLIVMIANSIDISAAGFIIRQVRYVLSHDVELKSIYAFAQTTLSDIKNSIIPDAGESNGLKAAAGADDITKDKSPDLVVGADGSLKNEDTSLEPERSGQTDQTGMTGQTDANGHAGHVTTNEVFMRETQSAGSFPETSVLAASSGDIDSYTSGQPGAFGMISPLIGPISTPFGEITGPGGFVRMHSGIDISVEYTNDVKAVLDGIVSDSGSAPGYGNFIRLSHDNGLTTVYGNCSSISVKINDTVKKGSIIAMVGEDSMTGGAHLHFEVWDGNGPVDPLGYIAVAAG